HPTNDADCQQKAARPDDGISSALRPQDVKKKEQRGQKEKSHKLLYAHHPRPGLWQEAQPGWLRRQQEIWSAHSGGDRDKHRQNNSGRLRKGESKGRSQKWRRAGGGKDSGENAWKKGAGV